MTKKRIFLLLGQSNMVGLGNLNKSIPVHNNNITVFNDGEWQVAKDPLHTDNPNSGVGLAINFANQVSKQFDTDDSIGLIPLAVASTSLSEWMPYSKLYTRIFTVLDDAKVDYNDIAGILWHQGESESKIIQKASSYADRFGFLVKYLRKDLNNPTLPIICGELGAFLDHRFPLSYIVNEQLHVLENKIGYLGVVKSTNLTSNSDLIHLDSKSLIEFGKRYASQFMIIVDET
jgi:hypothetical protein